MATEKTGTSENYNKNQKATAYLTSLLNKTLRISTTDSRIFVGTMKCTDQERNIILTLTHEYRQPPQSTIDQQAEILHQQQQEQEREQEQEAQKQAQEQQHQKLQDTTETPSTATEEEEEGVQQAATTTTTTTTPATVQTRLKVDMVKRFVGLVVVPGKYITKIEVED